MTATGEAKQRLMEIVVGEVSLVDHPANTETWVVTKRNQEAPVEPVQKAQLDPHTATLVTLNAVRDALWAVSDKLRDPSKLGEATAEVERIKTMLDSATTLAAEIKKSTDAFIEVVTKAKEGKKMPPWMKEQMKNLVDTVKAAMEEDATPEEKAEQTEKAFVGAVEVLKAGKAQFSKERASKLAGAFKDLGEMMKAADSDGFSKMVSEWSGSAKTEAPKETPVAPAAKSDEAPAWFSSAIDNLKKAVDGAANAAKEATTKVEAVAKRVDGVEKTAAESKALGQDGTADVKKSAPGFWSGVL